LGRVLDALRKGPLAGNTIVVLWSDHGWSLGEKFHWKKRVLWEEATRIPLIFAGHGLPSGKTSPRTVSLLDLYPTLVELCGLKPPTQALEGKSFVPLLVTPDRRWDHAAVCTEGRGNHAVRTERWRYIRYADGSEELYDHDADPNEWTNLANRESHQATKDDLKRWMPAREAASMPEIRSKCVTG
jgi:arylsulfatase A-like enzyme